MAKAKTESASRKSIYYSTEVFCKTNGGLILMSELAPELLKAETEENGKMTCKQFGILLPHLSPCANPHRIRYPDGRPFDLPHNKKPKYATWLLERIKTLNECLKLQSICLPIARSNDKKASSQDIFRMIDAASRLSRQLMIEVYHNYEWISVAEIHDECIMTHLEFLPQFPLVADFDKFQETKGAELQRQYGFDYHETSQQKRHKAGYWNNLTAASIARDLLEAYLHKHNSSDVQLIYTKNAQTLAKKYLEILDRYIEDDLDCIEMKMDSVSGTVKLVSCGGVASALNLWLLANAQDKIKYGVCLICGKHFVLGSQERKYCWSHEKSEIDYFNTKRRAAEKVAKQVELERTKGKVEN